MSKQFHPIPQTLQQPCHQDLHPMLQTLQQPNETSYTHPK